MGHARLGAGIILQAHTGLRPGELVRICPADLLFPEEQGHTLDSMPLCIALGPRSGTKVKRPQVVLLGPKLAPLVSLLRLTPLHSPIVPYHLSHYRRLLQQVESVLKLEVGWGPHSPRAGFASDSRAEGWSFEELREAGRWQSDSSLRTYLDIVSASNIQVLLKAADSGPALKYIHKHWLSFFTIERLQLPYAAQELDQYRQRLRDGALADRNSSAEEPTQQTGGIFQILNARASSRRCHGQGSSLPA